MSYWISHPVCLLPPHLLPVCNASAPRFSRFQVSICRVQDGIPHSRNQIKIKPSWWRVMIESCFREYFFPQKIYHFWQASTLGDLVSMGKQWWFSCPKECAIYAYIFWANHLRLSLQQTCKLEALLCTYCPPFMYAVYWWVPPLLLLPFG